VEPTNREGIELIDFIGNRLTPGEKVYRLAVLKKEITDGEVDDEFLPFLEAINSHPDFVTTQCCTGHGENRRRGGRQAHLDFRSAWPVERVVDEILRPLEGEVSVQLMLESDRLRYVLWMENDSWEKTALTLLDLLGVEMLPRDPLAGAPQARRLRRSGPDGGEQDRREGPGPEIAPEGKTADRGRWWCPRCKMLLEWDEVTFEETHDERAGGCGGKVVAELSDYGDGDCQIGRSEKDGRKP
jgi:hypothetical protein